MYQVTWVEHVEVDDRGVHNLYKHMVSTGHAFGAKRWVAILDRQCERLASVMATNISSGEVGGITYCLCHNHFLIIRIRVRMRFLY